MACSDFNGLSVLVTGSCRGIGESIADSFSKAGARVVRTTRSNDSVSIHDRTKEILSVDFCDEVSTRRFLDKVGSDQFDILVNNAGINKISNFIDIQQDDLDQIINVNLRGPFLLSQVVLPNMVRNGWGRIVNISSVFGVLSKAKRASYSVSKFGLDGLTAALSAEFAPQGILVNTVSPGFVRTSLTESVLGESGMQEIATTIPIGRLANREEISPLILWLCSKENTYVSGQNYLIDGGFSRV